MGDDRVVCLRLCANFDRLRQVCLQVLSALEAMGHVVSRWAASSASGALQRSPSPFSMRLGRPASGQRCQLDLMGHLILSSSCSATQSPSGRPEATDASWLTGFRCAQRESLAVALGVAPRVHLILERPLRVLPRQIGSLGSGA
jgi:hypothetical protein